MAAVKETWAQRYQYILPYIVFERTFRSCSAVTKKNKNKIFANI